jgi:hypothetical protein
VRFDFQNDQAEGVSIVAWNNNWAKRNTEPSVTWPGRKEFRDCVAGNCESHAARDHGIDTNDASTRVGKRST